MNQEKNSRPEALNSQAPNREAAGQPAAGGEDPVRGRRKSRRSTSAPTRLRQAAELLHSAPAASPAASAEAAAGSGKPAGQRSETTGPGAAGADSGTNGNLQAGTPRARAGSGILPRTAAEDDPRAWGDTPEDTSAWLREQRPPHWG